MHSHQAPSNRGIRGRGRRGDTSLLALQQVVGNQAMGQMVSRKPKPHHEANKPKHKKYSLTEAEMKWDVPMLVGHAEDAKKQNDLPHAAALLERVYELTNGRDVAHQLYMLYKQIGDIDEAAHWLDVSHGKKAAADEEPPVSYQQV